MLDRKMLMIGASLTLVAAPAYAFQSTMPAQSAPAANPAPAGSTPAATTPSAAPKIAQGATVYDPKGGTVGTIDSADAQYAVVATPSNKVKLPLSSFAAGEKGPVIAMTQAELDAAAQGAAKQLTLNVGDTVKTAQGAEVGKIEAVEGDLVTVATAKTKAKLPKTAFAMGDSGPVIGMTAEQLDAAAGAAGASAASASTTPQSAANPS